MEVGSGISRKWKHCGCECRRFCARAKTGTILIDDMQRARWKAQRTRSFIDAPFLKRLAIRETKKMKDGDHPATWWKLQSGRGDSYLWSRVLQRPERRKDMGIDCSAGDMQNQGRLFLDNDDFLLPWEVWPRTGECWDEADLMKEQGDEREAGGD